MGKMSLHCSFYFPVKYIRAILFNILDHKVAVFHSQETIISQNVWTSQEKQMSNSVTEYFTVPELGAYRQSTVEMVLWTEIAYRGC